MLNIPRQIEIYADTVLIDGVEVPWAIVQDGVRADGFSADECPTVSITFFTERILVSTWERRAGTGHLLDLTPLSPLWDRPPPLDVKAEQERLDELGRRIAQLRHRLVPVGT